MRKLEKKIGKIIDKAASSFIAYEDEDEVWPIVSVKLNMIKRNGIKEIWFLTYISFNRAEFFKHNRDTNVYFLHKSFLKGVGLAGIIDVLEASETKEYNLQKENELYEVEGVTDQVHCILKFSAARGWYFTNSKLECFNIN